MDGIYGTGIQKFQLEIGFCNYIFCFTSTINWSCDTYNKICRNFKRQGHQEQARIYSTISLHLDKRGNVIKFVEQFIRTSDCFLIDFVDIDTGLDIYECVFPTDYIGVIRSGNGSK